MEIKFSKKYQVLFELLNDKHPEVDIVILTGGRSSAKSFVIAVLSLMGLVEKMWNVLYTRFTNVSITDSIKPEVDDKIELLAYGDKVNSTNTHIEYKGNRIAFKGIKTGSKQQTANLKSLSGFNIFVVDEAEELPDYDTFEKVFLSIRSKEKRNLTFLLLNPTSVYHWIFQKFYQERNIEQGFNGIVGNVCYIHTSYLDVPKEYIADNIIKYYDYLKENEPKKYDQVVLGGWVEDVEGVLIPRSQLNLYNDVKLEDVSYKFAVGDPANTGGDNYSMLFCWVLIEQNKINVIVKDIIYSKDGIEALTDTIKEKLREYFIEDTYLEVNGVGLASYLLLKQSIENHTQIKPFTTNENKEAKILSNYEFVKKHFYFDKNYKSNTSHSNFINHLTGYEKEGDNKHKIDAIDNASMAAKVIKTKYKSILFG